MGWLVNMETFFSVPVFIFLFLTTYFEVFLLITYFESRESFQFTPLPPRLPGKHPSVTIAVPAWNEETTIEGTLRSLLALSYPKDRLFIYVIDDGSTDRTGEVAEAIAKSDPRVRVFRKENGGKYTAMNLALTKTTTDLFGCLDADSFVDPDALVEMIPYFDNPEVMAVTPSMYIHKPDNALSRMQSMEYMVGSFVRKIFSRMNGLYVTPGPFSIYRMSVFRKIGNFVHGFNAEDMEMAMRMQSNHMKIENSHTAIVYTVPPKTVRGLYKQRVRWVSGFLMNSFFSYRHMFLDRRYGNLGALTLPFAFLSIFIALFFVFLAIRSFIVTMNTKWVEWSALGFPYPSFGTPHIEWFSYNLGFQRLLVYVLLTATVFFMLMGIRMYYRKLSVTRNMIYFYLLYGLIAPFWLVRSLYNLVTAKEARWR